MHSGYRVVIIPDLVESAEIQFDSANNNDLVSLDFLPNFKHENFKHESHLKKKGSERKINK